MPFTQLTAAVVAPVLDAIERKAPLMVEKVRPRLVAILDYAAEQGIIVGNPLPRVRRGRKAERRHYPAVTDLPGVGEILRAGRASDPCKGIQRAHLLLVYTALRVSEVIGARWEEFDLKAGNWAVPRTRMKRKDAQRGPHVVPLPPTLLASLREWRESDGKSATFVCSAPRDSEKPITAEAVEKHYRRSLQLAGKHSPHSWRSAFSTICRKAGRDGDSIDAQLDHVTDSKVASANDRAKRLELRRELLTWYEDSLIAARDGTSVIALRKPT
jgi:integrase